MLKNTSEEQKVALSAAFKSFINDGHIHDWKARRAMATKIVELVVNDVYSQDLVSLIATEETYAPGEVLQFHTLRALKAYILDPGSTGKTAKLIKDSVTLPTNRVYVGTELDLDELRSGRFGSISDYRRLVAEVLLGERNKQLWDTMTNAIPSGSPDGNYATFASGASTATKKTALDDAIDYVHDNTNGGPAAIIGRFTALKFIYLIADQSNVNTYSDSAKDEIRNRGYLTTYRGVDVFYLRTYKDGDGVSKIDANNIFLVANDSLKFARKSPGLESFDDIRGDNFSWRINFWEEYGSLLVEPARSYRLEIS